MPFFGTYRDWRDLRKDGWQRNVSTMKSSVRGKPENSLGTSIADKRKGIDFRRYRLTANVIA